MTELSAVLAANTDSQASGGGSGNYTFLLLIALVIGAFFLMSRRTRKQQQQANEFRNQLQPGDQVMTGSGMLGTVVDVDDEAITLESVPGGARSRWVRQAILRKVEPPAPADAVEVELELEDSAKSEAERIAAANDAVIDVPDDLSSLHPKRKDDDEKK